MKLWIGPEPPLDNSSWIWARTFKTAMRLLEQTDWMFDIISTDYYLGGEKTGYHILEKILQRVYLNKRPFPLIGIHAKKREEQATLQLMAARINNAKMKH